MKTILVTGGAGFIGSWIVRHLLNAYPDCHVINLDVLTYAGNLDNLTDVADNPRYEFVHGDIRDANLVDGLMQKADSCIHAAAHTHVDRSITGPMIFTETNVVGTQVLLEAARTHTVEKFVLVSTDEVYGDLPLDTPERFTETTPLNPNNPYAASKAAADLIAMSYYHTYTMPVVITHCGNNYGPNQYPEKLIPFFILKLLNGEKVPVYGDGLNVRDWIHVSDHAAAVSTVLFKGRPGDVYNIGADHQCNNLTLTKQLLACFQQGEERINFVKDRPGHDRRYAIDATKLQTQLGWSPTIPFERGLQETIAWYQQNQPWLDRIAQRQQQEQTAPGAAWLK